MQNCDQYDDSNNKHDDQKIKRNPQRDVRKLLKCSDFFEGFNNDCILVLRVNVIAC